MIESPDDLLIFLDPDGHARRGQVRPRNGDAPYDVVGIFDDKAIDFNPNRWPGSAYQRELGAHFNSTGPRFKVRSIDVASIAIRDQVVVDGDARVFRLEELMPDGTGLVTLVLMEDGD